MLVLDATTKSIVAVMSGAQATTNPDFTAAWADNTGSAFTEGASDGAFNGTNSVTIVAAPAAATRRIIRSITMENRDTAPVTITLSYDNNGTLRTIAKVTLQVGDTWTTNGTFDTNGNLKQTIGVVNLATQVTGTLPIANGGTGTTSTTFVNLATNVTGTLPIANGGTGSTSTTFVNLTTNVTGTLPVANGGTGITSFGTGVATWLGTPSSANLASAVTDETGTGALVFANTPTLVTPVLGTPTSGNLSNCTVDGTDAVGFRNTPINSQSAAYTLVLADSGKTILHPSADTTARTFTIPANSSVAYPLGTVLTFVNQNGAGVVTIAITTDTMRLAGAGTTGSRTLAANGVATCVKLTSTEWIISGNGLT